MTTAIHWFRRDLRLTDNTALNRAAAAHDQVVPIYIPSTWKGRHHWCGAARQAFLSGCLQELDRNLRAKDSRLIVRSGDPVEVLETLAKEVKADAIYFNRDPDPHGRRTEEAVARMAERIGLAAHACKDHALHERDELLTGNGSPYRVFTPYARAWAKLEKAAPGRSLKRLDIPRSLRSDDVPSLAHWGYSSAPQTLEPGEKAARRRLEAFLDGPILRYDKTRDLPAEPGTSRISQDLRHGCLSIREVYRRCDEVRGSAKSVAQKQSVTTFINELIWREFYFQVLWHCPEVLEHEFQPEYRHLRWRGRWRPEDDGAWERDRSAAGDFERWQNGQTGYPIVDAAMRELNATGFMHNRARMIVAMFLTKDLRIWWMHGEAHFMQRLVDGEIASNNGGWQWSASTGTDAAPYFRIQNPWAQTKRFDPAGDYIKRWVPELRDVPAKAFFTPPAPGAALKKGYPEPMVNHATARERALKMFLQARSTNAQKRA